jgi:hypothetical protein
MELIPIILSVLEIVAGLTILTLIISYISFKIKQKNPQPGNEKDKIPDLGSNININSRPMSKINDAGKNIALSQKNHPGDNEKDYQRRNAPEKLHEKDKFAKPKARLEVLKQLSPDPDRGDAVNKEESKKHSSENLQSLNDDVFEKYSDNDRHEMFTLHVKENKDKPKEKK